MYQFFEVSAKGFMPTYYRDYKDALDLRANLQNLNINSSLRKISYAKMLYKTYIRFCK